MRKFLDVAVILLAVQILFSCSDEESICTTSDSGQIIARIDQPAATRTAVGDDVDGTNAVGIEWTDGDEIGVFDVSGAAQKRYAKVGQGTVPTASFSASGTTAFDSPVYAYYPYDEANASHNVRSLTGTLPAVQNMDEGKLHGDYKYGSATTATENGNYEFEFRHLFSLARITIDATGTPLQGETLKSLTMSVSRGEAGVPIAGNFTFSAEDGSWTQTGEGQSSITLEWSKATPVLSQSQTYYMSLFPHVRAGDLFTITVTTENHRAEFTATSLANFAAEEIYNFPVTLNKYESLKVINGLGYDFIAVSEDFAYHDELAGAMTDYSVGTYRGSVWNIAGKNDTDGLGFFWKRDGITATGETMVEFNESYGDLNNGANELIAKGFRHYVVTVASGIEVDVYITHMNTFGDGGNTEDDPHVHAQLSQLRQLRDYVVEQAKVNNRPAIIMGDTNMRYTRHQIVDNLITPVESDGLQIADPWIELHRGGVYPEWNTPSLMIRSKFGGGNVDILCADDQRGEVVDKMWYINVPTAAVQLKATSCMNNVDDFEASTEQVTYSGVTVEDANGNLLTDQEVTYTRVNGIADHFPVVVSFEYTNGN